MVLVCIIRFFQQSEPRTHVADVQDGMVAIKKQKKKQTMCVSVWCRRSSPGQVTEVRVGGGSEDLAADLTKLFHAIAEGDDLGGADESEVQRIEEQNHVLSCTWKNKQK